MKFFRPYSSNKTENANENINTKGEISISPYTHKQNISLNKYRNILNFTVPQNTNSISLNDVISSFNATVNEQNSVAQSIAKPFFDSGIFKSLTTTNYIAKINEYNATANEADLLLAKHFKYSLDSL